MLRRLAAVLAALCLVGLAAGCGTTTAAPTGASTRCYADYLPHCLATPAPGDPGWISPTVGAGSDRVGELPWISVSQLAPEARTVLQEIAHGGPFAYPGKDGSVFGNYEGALPKERRGYYREYTVPTPGAPTRGTRRIIAGAYGELYWTADHYGHFARIKETTTP